MGRRRFFSYLCVLVVGSVTGAWADTVLEYGLNEGTGTVVTDASDNNFHTPLRDSAEYSAPGWTDGYSGSALHFDGVGDLLLVGDDDRLDLNVYTIAVWVKYRANQNQRQEILEKIRSYWMNIRMDTRFLRSGGRFGSCGNDRWVFVDSKVPIPEDRWTFVATTFNGALLKVFVNGRLAGTKAATGPKCDSDHPLVVGAKHSPLENGGAGVTEAFFNGEIDELQIHDRALSDEEILALHFSRVGCGAPDINPIIDSGVYLWTDCGGAQTHLRTLGAANYGGKIEATENLVEYTPFDLETGDTLTSPNPRRLDFDFGVGPGDTDGVDFAYPTAARACIDLLSDAPVFYGKRPAAVTSPFELPSLGACASPSPSMNNIGDFVWRDNDRDGIQDAAEAGMTGVAVELLDCDNGSEILRTATTDQSGSYLFENLADGSYRLRFTAPAGYVFSPIGAGRDRSKDSSVTASGLTAQCYSMRPGQSRRGVDAGMYPLEQGNSALGNYVWNDTDRDGIQDRGESGISGMTVLLQDCKDGNRTVKSTTTSGNGSYLLSGLAAGRYRVKFVRPAGFRFSPKRAGRKRGKDSDANQSGVTACVNMNGSQRRLGIDAGLYPNS